MGSKKPQTDAIGTKRNTGREVREFTSTELSQEFTRVLAMVNVLRGIVATMEAQEIESVPIDGNKAMDVVVARLTSFVNNSLAGLSKRQLELGKPLALKMEVHPPVPKPQKKAK